MANGTLQPPAAQPLPAFASGFKVSSNTTHHFIIPSHSDPLKMLNDKQISAREELADNEFAEYDFGAGVTVADSDKWNRDDVSDFNKIVYITCEGDDPDADSEKVSFHVRFNVDDSVAETYGLLMRNGAEIGMRHPLQSVRDDFAEHDRMYSGLA
jgi:hypothetical protein